MSDKISNEMLEQISQIVKSSIPQTKTNKNGFEIRTKVLDIAKQAVWMKYQASWDQFEKFSGNAPQIPDEDEILKTAQKFYDFVSYGSRKNQ